MLRLVHFSIVPCFRSFNESYFQFYPIYKEVKNSKDTGSFEDFIECLKLYDKMENGTMMLGELEHILLSLGQFGVVREIFECKPVAWILWLSVTAFQCSYLARAPR